MPRDPGSTGLGGAGFLVGRASAVHLCVLAVGFIAGTRAGRERYEQMVKMARKTAENPAVRKVTRAAGDKATELTKAAKDKAATRVPKLTETAKSSATKVRGQFDRLPGRHSAHAGAESEPATVNGIRPAD